jgi:hypothetical protein
MSSLERLIALCEYNAGANVSSIQIPNSLMLAMAQELKAFRMFLSEQKMGSPAITTDELDGAVRATDHAFTVSRLERFL